MKTELQIPSKWQAFLKPFVNEKEVSQVLGLVNDLYDKKNIFPKKGDVFNAFENLNPEEVSVVILGQDPYHGEEQAHGYAFSVKNGAKAPPSLKNIFKEISSDCKIDKDPSSGNLENWSKQGVFLLNSILTVEKGLPLSHKNLGWNHITDAALSALSDKNENVVFMLWGSSAKNKISLIDESKHLILISPHPSPLSAYTGFFGSRHFSACNAYLKKHGKSIISW
jgi:uracil-DNA glycosylase